MSVDYRSIADPYRELTIPEKYYKLYNSLSDIPDKWFI